MNFERKTNTHNKNTVTVYNSRTKHCYNFNHTKLQLLLTVTQICLTCNCDSMICGYQRNSSVCVNKQNNNNMHCTGSAAWRRDRRPIDRRRDCAYLAAVFIHTDCSPAALARAHTTPSKHCDVTGDGMEEGGADLRHWCKTYTVRCGCNSFNRSSYLTFDALIRNDAEIDLYGMWPVAQSETK